MLPIRGAPSSPQDYTCLQAEIGWDLKEAQSEIGWDLKEALVETSSSLRAQALCFPA
jgi:hypothetical protein